MQEAKIKEILTFLQRTNDLKSVPRYSATLLRDQDTVAEHSWQLTMMVFIIGSECNVKIDLAKAMALALIHDLAESKTGDIDAYEVMTGQKSRDEKMVQEVQVMQDMTTDLSFGKTIYDMWEGYEDQDSVEAKFVRALDKIEAYLHIAQRGVEAYIPKEFHADYADKAVAAFDEATHHFPEVKDLLDLIKLDLKEKFETAGVKWKEK